MQILLPLLCFHPLFCTFLLLPSVALSRLPPSSSPLLWTRAGRTAGRKYPWEHGITGISNFYLTLTYPHEVVAISRTRFSAPRAASRYIKLNDAIFEKIDDTERRLAVPQLKHLEINCCSGCRFSSYYKIRIQDSRRTKRGRKWELSKGEGEDESDDADSLQCLTSAADERQDGMVPCVLSTLHCYETS